MANKEDQETLRLLVQHVARAFYEPKYIIILDQLARHAVLKDDDLAGRMGLQPKELNKVIAVLSTDCLVKVYRQNELKEGAQRSVGRQYYYIDYQYFCNVVKWRVAKMMQIIDSSLRNELDNKGYVCTLCKQSYSPLDVDKLMDFSRGIMVCEICHAEVVDNENAESVQGSKDRMKRFHHQLRFIKEGLQKSEAMVLPAFDVAAWVKAHVIESDKQKSSSTRGDLKIAGSDPNKKEDEGVGIMMAMDKDEATRRQERAAEAELKRQQNALPAWHLKSTITGDLTALGIQEHARAEAAAAAAAAVAATGSNDDILKGLGVVGGSASLSISRSNTVVEQSLMMNGFEEEKPQIGQEEADYYEQYYASLAASTNVSALPTPTAGGSHYSSEYGGDFDDEEEEKKPNIQYLDSLNDYRKRSRSKEDVGSGSVAKGSKLAKLHLEGLNGTQQNGFNGNGIGVDVATATTTASSGVGTPVEDQNGYNDMGDSYIDGAGEDDPMVYVNGKPVPYSQVTEEHHDMMTPDEYTAYFDIMQARS
ncbi:hypothetical protein AGABI1DRAFT_130505 [Agaricus bisporus var. burnettii JB137-S8]|uniref:HTH TFE/IIEalpha-type domain-containing protein n=1 Tax=Agaricus bisporus var. burnettii (strain JB137-S8 / ATCC MYA-4627 / FGSC 10392) TaxID=597362 RepID=K5X2N5_AGABU|nr:uncharacterized protein AGABI1DRAFT_130505 [Agaricus bisporus var. burnettii JB137-S8]EKM77423.1 hypothetical protein AGABI1DRAFT_130505 [Agaricus bisporus var. burnettii JB137-S8]